MDKYLTFYICYANITSIKVDHLVTNSINELITQFELRKK